MKRIYEMNAGLNKRFPNGNEPFQIIARLAEECGELAAEVNHFEGAGVKQEKWGEPNRSKLAKEIMDVVRCALQVAMYYQVEDELEKTIEIHRQRMVNEGLISE